MSRRSFSYTPLLIPVRVNLKPKNETGRLRRERKIREAIQQPLPLSVGETSREYILKINPNKKSKS